VADLGPFKLLDVAASRDEAGKRLTLSVVNRSPERAIPTTLELGRAVNGNGSRIHSVAGPSPMAANSFAETNRVGVTTQPLGASGNRIEVVFPRHSISCLELSLA
jgi:alpha-N-arabinofuranosidase